MKHDLARQMKKLKNRIENTDISMESRSVKEWAGADVLIKRRMDTDTKKWLGGQPLVASFQNTKATRRAVITEHSKELSWLFHQLKDLFSDQIDYVSKYDFYGLLAQSAIDSLANNEGPQDPKGLLLEVLNAAKGFCDDEAPQ
ncbi:MAG: hypothetical protein SWH78_15765 [Thermodesulfobacteriota bacterium]|nr:hypothetical protein [Thermodesulfobacteriota bacterium]